MDLKINLISSLKTYKKYIWVFIPVFLFVFIGGLVFIKLNPDETKYISSSKFEIINGDITLNLYRGVYHHITTFDDMASVLRSNEVLREVIKENDIDTGLDDFRQNIDLYEDSKFVYILELIYPDKLEGEKINLSIINNYLEIIKSRLHPEHIELFDVKVLQNPVTRVMSSRIIYKIIAVFLFGIFCGIIIILGVEIIRRIKKINKIHRKSK